MKKLYRTRKEIVGAFAYWITRQSPYVPDNLTEILNYVNDVVSNYKQQNMQVLGFEDTDSMGKFIHDVIFNHPLITDLNKSLNEKMTGNKDGDVMFVSRYSQPKPEDDFVDLDALYRNINRQLSVA